MKHPIYLAVVLCVATSVPWRADASGGGSFWSTATSSSPHPAVVRVIVPDGDGVSLGSGALVGVTQTHGLVLTNWHVVRDVVHDGVGQIVVAFPDGFRSGATLLGTDRDWDLAALAIWRPRVEPIRLAARPPVPGEPLQIAGYGPGSYRTATGRCIQYVSPGGNHPFEMVELSAAAREGDSGGPILNQRGELAGVLFGSVDGRTTGSHSRPVRRFLASVSGRFGELSPSSAMLAGRAPSGTSTNVRTVSQPVAAVSAPEHARFASNPSSPPVDLSCDGWTAAGQSPDDTLAGFATDLPDEPRPQEDLEIERSPIEAGEPLTWEDVAGTTGPEQFKTVLAAIGALAVVSHLLRFWSRG